MWKVGRIIILILCVSGLLMSTWTVVSAVNPVPQKKATPTPTPEDPTREPTEEIPTPEETEEPPPPTDTPTLEPTLTLSPTEELLPTSEPAPIVGTGTPTLAPGESAPAQGDMTPDPNAPVDPAKLPEAGGDLSAGTTVILVSLAAGLALLLSGIFISLKNRGEGA